MTDLTLMGTAPEHRFRALFAACPQSLGQLPRLGIANRKKIRRQLPTGSWITPLPRTQATSPRRTGSLDGSARTKRRGGVIHNPTELRRANSMSDITILYLGRKRRTATTQKRASTNRKTQPYSSLVLVLTLGSTLLRP